LNADEPTPRIHVIFKTHLDVGFTDLARNVVDRYLCEFIPSALETAETLRRTTPEDRFIWTTGSWLIFEFLERGDSAQRARMERAIEAGDIAWHGLPFTMHCELLDPSLFAYGLSFARVLDERFGRNTIAAKMTDVPGHTRGIVSQLAKAGIEFLHIGVNEGATMPDVPPVFVWRDTAGSELVVMYEHSYGESMSVPGIADSISFAHTNDNRGPQSPEEVGDVYASLRSRHPNARVVASTLNDFAIALRDARSSLPTVSQEIGDTWIHGAGSDPGKVARYRELCRIRTDWMESDPTAADDRAVEAFSRNLILVPEHTWGLDEKTHLADHDNYSQSSFISVRSDPAFARMARSWDEQRAYVDDAVAALGRSARRDEVESRLSELVPERPDVSNLRRVHDPNPAVETDCLAVGFDLGLGSVSSLITHERGTVLADAEHPIGLFAWQNYSHEDYERYLSQYVTPGLEWAVQDVGRTGLAESGALNVRAPIRVTDAWRGFDGSTHTVVLMMTAEPAAPDLYGGPTYLTVAVSIPAHEPEIHFDVQWFGKPESRLPQSGWFSFVPRCGPRDTWRLRKLGQWVRADDIVSNGSRNLHGVQDLVECARDGQTLCFRTLDAPLVAIGRPSLLDFTNQPPDTTAGIHFNLYNNVWSTNFPSWYGGDAKFRFTLRIQDE